MSPWPKDLAALRTLEKLSVLLCDEGRDKGKCNFGRDGYEDDVAIRAAIVPLSVHVEIDPEISMELMQLSFDDIACDQGAPATEKLAQCQTPISREQPTLLAYRSLDQCFVRDYLFIRCVVAENAQPACQTTKHGIGYER